MGDREDTLTVYDLAIAELVAYDEANDPARAALLRTLFAAQRVFFTSLSLAVGANTTAVSSLAERVQGYIGQQLLDVLAAQGETNRQHLQMLVRMDAQDVLLRAIHDCLINGRSA